MKKRLTDTFISRTPLSSGSRITITDTVQRGLLLRIGKTTKIFYCQFRMKGGGPVRKIKLGYFPEISVQEAREHAASIMKQVHHGGDPTLTIQENKLLPTLQDFADTYLQLHAIPNKAPRSVQEDKRQLHHYIIPALGHLKMNQITRRHLIALLDSISETGPVQANRTKALLSRLFKFAVERGIIEISPVHNIPTFIKERPRDKVLSAEEIRLFWQATEDHCTPRMRDILRLLLITGQRKSEILKMHWQEIDLENALWTLPASRTKNGKPHIIPLSPLARDILRPHSVRAGQEREGYVFPGAKGCPHIKSTGPAITRLRRATGLDFRPHDLRRTCATNLARLGCSELPITPKTAT